MLAETSGIETTLQDLESRLMEKLNAMDTKLREMDINLGDVKSDVAETKSTVISIDSEVPGIGHRTSESLILMKKAIQELAAVKEKVEGVDTQVKSLQNMMNIQDLAVIKEKIEAVHIGVKTLQNNNQFPNQNLTEEHQILRVFNSDTVGMFICIYLYR